MSSHRPFDDQYWNLAQACAWVEYREQQMVNDFQDLDRNAYMAIGMYPSMWPTGRKRRGSIKELRRALEEARLTSQGYHVGEQARLAKIAPAEWADLAIRPLFAYVAKELGAQKKRWIEFRVLCADMKRLWRSISEVEGRSKFDWPAIKEMYQTIEQRQPSMSQNMKIEELQLEFQERFNKEPPARTTIQRNIKTWT